MSDRRVLASASSGSGSSSSSSSSSSGSLSWTQLGALVAAVGAGVAIGMAIQRRQKKADASSASSSSQLLPSDRDGELIITAATRSLFARYEETLARGAPVGAPARPPVTDALIAARFWRVYHRAMSAHRYRCIEEKRFMEPRIVLHPFYATLVGPVPTAAAAAAAAAASASSSSFSDYSLCPRLRKPVDQRRVLDIGCCFGTDLRCLVAAGFAPANLLGVDINDTFITLGRDLLFDDRNAGPGSMAERFCVADMLRPEAVAETPLLHAFSLDGIDAVYAGSVFHLFGLADTERLASALLRTVSPGGCIFGRTVGVTGDDGMEVQAQAVHSADLRYLHSAASLARLLESTGFTRVRIERRPVDMAPKDARWSGADQIRNEGRSNQMLTFYAEKPTTTSS